MEKQVEFVNHENEKLRGTLHLPDAPTQKGAVLGHCFTCSRHTRILIRISKALAGAGFMALRFDFSGNGQSEGDFDQGSYSKHIREMETAVEFLQEKGAEWIGLAGHSMGAAIAVLTARRLTQVKAVCALAGRLSGIDSTTLFSKAQLEELEQTGKMTFTSRGRQLELTDRFFQDARRHDLPETIKALEKPLLIIHGDRDEIVSVENARIAHGFKNDGIELYILPGADHMFSDDAHQDDIARRVTEWFKKG